MSRRIISLSARLIRTPLLRPRVAASYAAIRHLSGKVYTYEEVKRIAAENPKDKLLIDVREPHEYKDGFIPTAINIPVTSRPNALLMTPEDFESTFNFEKPPKDVEVIMYCKAGIRSTAAATIAETGGYEHVSNYKGSYDDWLANSSKTPSKQDE